jgi:crotonobetainyl-CoA:carnitine CoA-transferase CaiB-like acyl-CoA transferase
MPAALSRFRICDFTGQLAGAGATKWLSAFGADVIRIEDPVRQGTWDILRTMPPFVDERRGIDFGGGFNNHNTDKRGITLNLRTERGKELLTQLIEKSDVVTENFAYGVLDKWGFGYERLQEIKPDIVYVSNCGFGHTGPYKEFKTWGPIVQAMCGLTFSSGLPGREPAGWGYSYMDHTGAYYMAMAILLALIHREKTGEGQWVDMACTEAGASLNGPHLLDFTVNGRPLRRDASPNSNRSDNPVMAPHGIFACAGDDEWVGIACRSDEDWRALAGVIGGGVEANADYATTGGRVAAQDALEAIVTAWTSTRNKFDAQRTLVAAGVPAAAVQKPQERIDQDPDTAGLWPSVEHQKMGAVRVDGLGVTLSETPWEISKGGPVLGQHNDEVFTEVLGLSAAEVDALREGGVI